MGSNQDSGIPQLNWRFRVPFYLDATDVSEVLTKPVGVGEVDAGRAKFLQTDRKAKSRLVGFLFD